MTPTRISRSERRAILRHLRGRYRTELTWRDHFMIIGELAWIVLIALILGGFGFVIMVASQLP